MNKSESKYYNTARLMDEALLLLLDKKEFEYITVKEICEKAGVNRSTFYLHYESTADLLAESIEYLNAELRARYEDCGGIEIEKGMLDDLLLFTPRYSIPYLQFLKEHKKAFMTAVSHPGLFGVHQTYDTMYKELFEPILSRYNVPDGEKNYMVKFYMNGIHAIVIEWLKGNCADEVTFIADLIVKCINHNFGR